MKALFLACLCLATATGAAEIKKPAGTFLMRPRLAAAKFNALGYPRIILREDAAFVFATATPNFSRIEAAIKTLPAGAKYQLEVLYGTQAPQRWKAQGVKWMKFAAPSPERPAGEMPVPWDQTARMLHAGEVAQLAKRFDGDANCLAVHCAHPVMYSAEFHMPKEITRTAGWQGHMAAAWQASVDAHEAAFKSTMTVLDLSACASDNCAVATAVEKYAEEKLGARLGVQMNAWNARESLVDAKPYQLVKAAHGRGVWTGLEQVTASTNARYGGSFSASLKRATWADWKIIYEGDLGKLP